MIHNCDFFTFLFSILFHFNSMCSGRLTPHSLSNPFLTMSSNRPSCVIVKASTAQVFQMAARTNKLDIVDWIRETILDVYRTVKHLPFLDCLKQNSRPGIAELKTAISEGERNLFSSRFSAKTFVSALKLLLRYGEQLNRSFLFVPVANEPHRSEKDTHFQWDRKFSEQKHRILRRHEFCTFWNCVQNFWWGVEWRPRKGRPGSAKKGLLMRSAIWLRCWKYKTTAHVYQV